MKKNYKRGLTASQYSVFKSLIEKGYTAFEAKVMAKEMVDDYKEYSNYDDNYDDSFFYQSLVTPTFILYKSFQMVDVRFGFDSTKYTLEEMFESMLQS